MAYQKPRKTVTNAYGVRIPKSELEEFEKLVERANRKRSRMLNEEKNLMFLSNGKSTGRKLAESKILMGKTSDFVLAPKSKNIDRFQSKKEFNRYKENLIKVTDRNYIKERVKLYRENYIKGMYRQMGTHIDGEKLKQIEKNLRSMTPTQFRRFAQQEEAATFEYIYSPIEAQNRAKKWYKTMKFYDLTND